MNPLRPSVQRRHRILRLQRLDMATTGLLAALVVTSLLLVRFLFFQPETAALVQAGGPGARYHTPSAALGKPDPQDLIVPEQLALLYAGGSGDTGLSTPTRGSSPGTYQRVWQAVLQLMGTITAGQMAAAHQEGFKPVAEALAALAAESASANTVGVDVTLGYGISQRDLLTAAQEAPPANSPSPTFDRIVLLSGTPGGGPEVFLLAGSTATGVPLTAEQFSPLRALVAGVRDHVAGAAYPLRPLGGTGVLSPAVKQAVAARQAILVPYNFAWQPVAMQSERLNSVALATAIFPDMLDVATAQSDGVLIYTNSMYWLLKIVPKAGQETLFVPSPTSSPAPRWYPGLQQVLNYVYRVGGWPGSAWLAGFSQTPGSCLARCEVVSRSYDFSVDAGGLPVLEPPGTNALAVTLTGDSGQPSSYSRVIPLAGQSVLVSSQAIRPATAAAIALAGAGQTGSEVLQIFPAMTPSRGQLRPVWAVVLGDPNPSGGAPQTVLVDAYSGTLLSAPAGGG